MNSLSMGAGDDSKKKSNTLPIWGNATTMNLNPLIFTNIQNSPYFKGPLSELKTYHEVVDEIYYKVTHLEPWEKRSRPQTMPSGMCGGVRGVGAGGISSSAFCLLYKMFTLRLTRKQVNGLLNHRDSPYIRSLGFMYVRFTQPPADLWEWFEAYIDDAEEVDVRAGGGQTMTIGEMCCVFLTKLEWCNSLFPRIPVPIQMAISQKLAARNNATSVDASPHRQENREGESKDTSRDFSRKRRNDDERYSDHRSQGSSSRTHRRNRSRSSSKDYHRKEKRRSSSRQSSHSSSKKRYSSRSPNKQREGLSSRCNLD